MYGFAEVRDMQKRRDKTLDVSIAFPLEPR